MENRNGRTASSTEAIPAGHAALTEAEERGEGTGGPWGQPIPQIFMGHASP